MIGTHGIHLIRRCWVISILFLAVSSAAELPHSECDFILSKQFQELPARIGIEFFRNAHSLEVLKTWILAYRKLTAQQVRGLQGAIRYWRPDATADHQAAPVDETIDANQEIKKVIEETLQVPLSETGVEAINGLAAGRRKKWNDEFPFQIIVAVPHDNLYSTESETFFASLMTSLTYLERKYERLIEKFNLLDDGKSPEGIDSARLEPEYHEALFALDDTQSVVAAFSAVAKETHHHLEVLNLAVREVRRGNLETWDHYWELDRDGRHRIKFDRANNGVLSVQFFNRDLSGLTLRFKKKEQLQNLESLLYSQNAVDLPNTANAANVREFLKMIGLPLEMAMNLMLDLGKDLKNLVHVHAIAGIQPHLTRATLEEWKAISTQPETDVELLLSLLEAQ